MQYTVIHNTKMNLSTVKLAQWDKTQSRELLGLFLCVCIALCTIVAHIFDRTDLIIFPLTLQTITIATMTSTWGKGGLTQVGLRSMLDRVHIGAPWRIRLNRSRAVAMWSYSQITLTICSYSVQFVHVDVRVPACCTMLPLHLKL